MQLHELFNITLLVTALKDGLLVIIEADDGLKAALCHGPRGIHVSADQIKPAPKFGDNVHADEDKMVILLDIDRLVCMDGTLRAATARDHAAIRDADRGIYVRRGVQRVAA